MKIFAFRTRLILFSIIQNFFAMQLLIFGSTPTKVGFGLFGAWVHSRRLSLHHSATPQAGGGLKWTRTIDLTLIRRVL